MEGIKRLSTGRSDDVCGRTQEPSKQRVSWWWKDECAVTVNEKPRLFVEKEMPGV